MALVEKSVCKASNPHPQNASLFLHYAASLEFEMKLDAVKK